MIRVLVVDDSAFMRKALSMMLDKNDDIEVVETARDGREAVEASRRLKPDVVTMDVEMPRMDGITALKTIMKDDPRPVIMVSSLTKEGAETTLRALEAGAVDFIPKDHSRVSLRITDIEQQLSEKVRHAAQSNMRVLSRASRRARRASSNRTQTVRRDEAPSTSLSYRRARIVVVGVSTGGPFALQKIIPLFPADFPLPVVVVQHMPPHFTASLAKRLDQMSDLPVREAEDQMPIESGTVYIAQGGKHLVFEGRSRLMLRTPDEPADVLHKPSVDVMFNSAAEAYNGRVLGAILTGMGKDGREGARMIREKGGRIIAQDEESCVVYGMPRAVAEAGLVDAVVPLDHVADTLVSAVRGTKTRAEQ